MVGGVDHRAAVGDVLAADPRQPEVEVEGRLPDEDLVEPEDPEPLPEECELEDPLPEDELLPELPQGAVLRRLEQRAGAREEKTP